MTDKVEAVIMYNKAACPLRSWKTSLMLFHESIASSVIR